MTFNYDRVANTALRQIIKFGGKFTVTRRITGTYNPATSTATITESSQSDISGVFNNYEEADIDGTLIKSGDTQLLIPAVGVTRPENEDTVTDASSTKYTIKKVTPIQPNGLPVLYILQVRR